MKIATLLIALFLPLCSLQAAYTLKKGKLIKMDYMATMSVQEHYSAALEAYDKHDWNEVVHQSLIITKNFPETPFAQEILFYIGVGYFHQREFDLSNKNLTTYLKNQTAPKHFAEAIEYKFSIAEQYQKGARKHLLGWEAMPQWMPAREEAIEIFDEVISALPHHELAAKALFGKARLLLKEEDFRAAIETYQTLIRRFPRHPLASECYIGIGEVYYTQARTQYPDPDYLDLAEINLRKYRLDFPGEERHVVAEKMIEEMKEIYASSLYETGKYYLRTKKPAAANIYFAKVVQKYPSSKTAKLAQNRIDQYSKKHKLNTEMVAEGEKP